MGCSRFAAERRRVREPERSRQSDAQWRASATGHFKTSQSEVGYSDPVFWIQAERFSR